MSGTFATRRALLAAGLLAGACRAGGRIAAADEVADGSISPGFGRARRCLLLFMWGGPSHLDTFDPKPEAPTEIRGPFQAISTRVPGIQVSEHFERVAQVADKLAFVRSLTHDDPAHLSSAHTLLTGHLPPVNKSDAEPPSERDAPHLGSMLSRLRPATTGLPAFVTLPWLAYHPAAPGGKAPGQNGGWLGRSADPLLIEGDPNAANWEVPALTLASGLDAARVGRRRELLARIDAQQRRLDEFAHCAVFSDQQRQAFGLLASPDVRKAFELRAEPDALRDRYGRHTHGQCALLARRLLEHEVPFVSVNWPQDDNPFWDTHGDNFNKLQRNLIPPADRALSALLSDLDERGLLEDTIVAWVGEFGRAPKINGSAGREHHPGCYTGLLAGAGIRGGQVYGASDATGAAPRDCPVSPHDFAATLLHALGVPTATVLPDRGGRPHLLYAGRPLTELWS